MACSWCEANVMNSSMHWFSTAFDGAVGFFPSLIAGLLILCIGYILGRVLQGVTRSLLGRFGFDRFLTRLGLIDAADAHQGSHWTGTAVFGLVMLAAVMQAARAWNLQMVANGISDVIGYVPHLAGAAVIFAAALYFGNWVRDRVSRSMRPEGQRSLVAASVRAGVLALGAFMALRELQIAPEIVTIAFTLTLAAIALAAALAFGLGSRNVAGQVTQQWYERQTAANGASMRDAASVTTQTWPGAGSNRP
jgi:Conserved TM helix